MVDMVDDLENLGWSREVREGVRDSRDRDMWEEVPGRSLVLWLRRVSLEDKSRALSVALRWFVMPNVVLEEMTMVVLMLW